MIENLLFGFPYDRPGGLLLSIIYFFAASGVAMMLGVLYCYLCISYRSIGIALQFLTTLTRGIPLLLLVFFCANLPGISVGLAGLLALVTYSLTHVGEILRGFMNGYPQYLSDQSNAIGLNRTTEWLSVRIPWVVSKSMPALLTHWVSLLKDSGALIVISIGELTTVAKSLSESARDFSDWMGILLVTAAFYLVSTLILIQFTKHVYRKLFLNGGYQHKEQAMG